MALAVVVLSRADPEPAKTFVKPDGRCILGHDVEDKS